jgi:hypothetical protein
MERSLADGLDFVRTASNSFCNAFPAYCAVHPLHDARDCVLDVDNDAPQAPGDKLALPQYAGTNHVERPGELHLQNRLVALLPLEPLEVLERSEGTPLLLFGVENCLTGIAVLLWL